ncbi:DNA polymerase beta superfamily protein [Bacillus sp. REN16]|uniref:DNA polymerase beta superfamily protein n=1 Tax=Bacillus sp. REN16 TaxID=2887296 RepID=UPI003B63F1FE
MPINSQVDMSGWELTKALRLFRKSNPALIEWLHSNIIYYEDNILLTKMKQLEKTVFSPIPCMYHYVKWQRETLKTFKKKKHK